MLRRTILAFALAFACSSAVADDQSDRQALIQRMIALGAFEKIEIPGNLPHVWVTPAFKSLTFETKSKFISVVYAYYFTLNPLFNIVVLKDSQTGKRIGTYTADFGLDLK